MKTIFLALVACLPLAAKAQLADSNARLVHVQGAVNFRDLGGYPTADGHIVKWGKLYRSADISRLSDADLDTLKTRHVHTVIDFRGTAESQKAPDRLLPQTDYTLCPAGSDSLPDPKKMAQLIVKDSVLTGIYGSTRYLGARYRPFFQKLIALPGDQALLFHCTGGRDRTGIGAALLLYALGVPKEKIYEDFTASNVYLQGMTSQWAAPMAKAAQVDESVIRERLRLRPELLEATFNAIRKDYGSMERFYEQELGMGPKELKKLKAAYTM